MKVKRFSILMLVLAALVGAMPAEAAPVWTPWAVGSTGSTTVAAGVVTFNAGDDGVSVWTTGQTRSKAFYSTDTFNGLKVGDLLELSYELLFPDASAVPPPEEWYLKGPYLNIVVTDGIGGFSYLLLDAMPAPVGQQRHVLSTAQFRGNEGTGALAAWNDVWKSYSDVKDLYIAAGFASNPGGVAPIGGWTGPGANDGIIFAVGNRGSTPTPMAQIQNVDIKPVPEPTTLMLLGLGLAAAGRKLRRR